MTYTSPRAKRRLFPSTAIGTDTPVDPAFARDAIANNLLHLADEAHAKVLVCDIAADDTLITGGGNAPEVTTITISSDEWRAVQVYGPFDLSVRMIDGVRRPYAIRPMIYAPSLDVTWAVQLVLPDDTGSLTGAVGSLVAPNDCQIFTSTGSSSPQWLALASGDVIQPTETLAGAALAPLATIDGPGGVATSAYVTGICARVLCKGSGTVALYGCVLAEYLA